MRRECRLLYSLQDDRFFRKNSRKNRENIPKSYGEIHHEAVVLPDRVCDPACGRKKIPPQMYMPKLLLSGSSHYHA